MSDNDQTLLTILEALTSIISGDLNKEFSSPTDDEISVKIFNSLSTLISHLKEINAIAVDLANGSLDVATPHRRNYLSAPLKTLHSKLSILMWNAKQAVNNKVASHTKFDGELYQTINILIDQIADHSLKQQSTMNSDTLSIDSWKYHQLLLALGKLTIMVLLVNNKGEIVYANEKAKSIFSEITSFLDIKISDDEELISFIASIVIQKDSHTYSREEFFDASRDKWFTVISENIDFINDQTFQMYVINDITDRKTREITLKKTASTDTMTGLYNKHGGLDKFIQSAQNFDEDCNHCVAFVDLDGLKYVNDTFGHKEGDFFIKEAANILVHSGRQADVAIRFGGDEFVMFFINCEYGKALHRLSNARRKLENFEGIEKKPYSIGFSFGIVQFNYTRNTDIFKIIEQADKEMYLDKRQRKAMREY